MAKLQIFNSKGTKSEEMDFPKEMQVAENTNLLTQALYVFENRSHKGTRKTKTRSEVSLSTKKIYRQKGTGGARHGDKKAPIFVGGGVAHGPRGNKRILSLSKNQKRFVKKMVLTLKNKEKKLGVVSGLENIKSTKEASVMLKNVLKSVESKAKNVMLILADDKNNVYRYLRNLKGVNVGFFNDFNLRKMFVSGFVIVDKAVFGKTPAANDQKEVKTEKKETKVTPKKVSKSKK